MFAHGITVVVVRPGGRDRNGDPLPGSEHEIEDVTIYPASVEVAANGTTLDADLVMLRWEESMDVMSEDVIYLKSDTARANPMHAKGDAWNITHPMNGWFAGSRALLKYGKGGRQ